MSYARWSHSCWYVYWDCSSGKTLEDQHVTVQDHGTFTYEELKKDLDSILDGFRDCRFERNPRNYKGEGKPPKDRFTEDEIQELKGYLKSFTEDCEFRFNPENIKKYGDLVNLIGRG